MSLLGFLRIRLFEWEGVPMPAAKDRPQAIPCNWTDASAAADGASKVLFTWIGHAGCHFRIPTGDAGSFVTVLTDPVLSYRCSPSQLVGPARLQKPPTTIAEMASSDLPGVWPDVLVLSHNHYDHLDHDTIKALIGRPNGRPVPHIFCTLGVADFFYGMGLPKEGVTELDWWQQREIHWQQNDRTLRLTCVPAQHFSGRGLADRNRSVWAGWTIEAPATGKKVYFAGDSGYRAASRAFLSSGKPDDSLPYCPAFEEIGSLLGPFDLAAIPIGAYKPRIAMSPIHMDPIEAVHVHRQVRAKRSVGIHWASFALAAEPVYEPKEMLAEELSRQELDADQFITMEIGQTKAF
jgi:L-ascorbate metabolism protein UlaG (beta-lactamase superfamily)